MFDNRKTFTGRTAFTLAESMTKDRACSAGGPRGSLDLDLSIGPRYVTTPPKMSRANGFSEFRANSVFLVPVRESVLGNA